MIKFAFILFGLVGMCFVFTTYAPQMWAQGFFVKEHFVPYAAPCLAVFGMLGLKLKYSK